MKQKWHCQKLPWIKNLNICVDESMTILEPQPLTLDILR